MSTMPLDEATAGPNHPRNTTTSPDPPAATAPPEPVQRHRWEKTGKYSKRCLGCGLHALQRPHPYARRWWTEWTRGEEYWNTLQGDKAPPCTPAS